MKRAVFLVSLFIIFMMSACKKEITPRPYGYFRIDLPEQKYQELDTIPVYKFDMNKVAVVRKTDKTEAHCIDICYPELKGTIYCSYKEFKKNDFPKVSEESRELAYKHVVRAEAITEQVFVNDSLKVYGILYDFKGNAASPVQFFLTDSVSHYFRGSLYFNARVNPDSIAPVAAYVRRDIVRLVESFEWK